MVCVAFSVPLGPLSVRVFADSIPARVKMEALGRSDAVASLSFLGKDHITLKKPTYFFFSSVGSYGMQNLNTVLFFLSFPPQSEEKGHRYGGGFIK
jgi:hypothetical protein